MSESLQKKNEQLILNKEQLDKFNVECFAKKQVADFVLFSRVFTANDEKCVLDIGGGHGYFSKLLSEVTNKKIIVIDTDQKSIETVNNLKNPRVEGFVWDALKPLDHITPGYVCFNLVLHHLIGVDENATRCLQKRALTLWINSAEYVFVNEYIYESIFANFSSRLIYQITKNKLISKFGKIIARFVPSLRANTFGIGVRFRAHNEWVELFEDCGYEVLSRLHGPKDRLALPLRLLLIKEARIDSFLLTKSSVL